MKCIGLDSKDEVIDSFARHVSSGRQDKEIAKPPHLTSPSGGWVDIQRGFIPAEIEGEGENKQSELIVT